MFSRARLKQIKWNHNLVVTFIYRITFSTTAGLWQSGTASNYIYYLENQGNFRVGLVQGIQGLATTIASFPFGIIADRLRRDIVLKTGGICGILAIIFINLAVTLPKKPLPFYEEWDIKYFLFMVGFIFWGVVQAGNPIVESILADSVPTGGRSQIYTSIFFISMLGRSVGPIVAAIIFVVAGNVWSVHTLGISMIIGMVLSIIPIGTLFFFNDNKTLGQESEAIRRHSIEVERSNGHSNIQADEKVAENGEPTLGQILSKEHNSKRFWLFRLESIPYIISAADLLVGLASGCTIKFFPIFFADVVKLSPVSVNILMAVQPVSIALCAFLGQHLSQIVGRVQVVVLLRVMGVSFITIMGLFPRLWSMPVVIIALYLLRTAVNNSGYPIQKAILMDYVPKKNRGKWGALDSFTQFGWSGSAFLGGFLIDKAGFDTCFLITAAMQGLGMLMLFPLLISVPKQEKLQIQSSGLDDPLLEGGSTAEEIEDEEERTPVSPMPTVANTLSHRDPEASLLGSSLGRQSLSHHPSLSPRFGVEEEVGHPERSPRSQRHDRMWTENNTRNNLNSDFSNTEAGPNNGR